MVHGSGGCRASHATSGSDDPFDTSVDACDCVTDPLATATVTPFPPQVYDRECKALVGFSKCFAPVEGERTPHVWFIQATSRWERDAMRSFVACLKSPEPVLQNSTLALLNKLSVFPQAEQQARLLLATCIGLETDARKRGAQG